MAVPNILAVPAVDDYYINPRAVKIASFKNDQLVPDHEEIRKIMKNEAIVGKQVSVLSVVGTKRVGKSVLASLIVQTLDKSLDKSRTVFEYSSMEDPCTRGVYAWSKPLVNNYATECKCVTLVLDTQGMGDGRITRQAVNNMFIFCAAVSSMIIFSVEGQILEQNLDSIALCGSMARAVQTSSKENSAGSNSIKIFQDLIISVHDFKFSPNENGEYGFARGDLYLAKSFDKSATPAMHEIKRSLYGGFKRVRCCVLPNPGKKMQKYRGFLSEMDEEFVKEVKTLITTALQTISPVMVGGNNQGNGMTCRLWTTAVKDYDRTLQESNESLLGFNVKTLTNWRIVQVNRLCKEEAEKTYDRLAWEHLTKAKEKIAERLLLDFHKLWAKQAKSCFKTELARKACQKDASIKQELLQTIEQRINVITAMNEKNESWMQFAEEHPLLVAGVVAGAGMAVAGGGATVVGSLAAGATVDEAFTALALFAAELLQALF